MIYEAIKSFVAASSSLADINLTEIIESRLGGFAKWRFSKENGATVKKAFKKARHENYTC